MNIMDDFSNSESSTSVRDGEEQLPASNVDAVPVQERERQPRSHSALGGLPETASNAGGVDAMEGVSGTEQNMPSSTSASAWEGWAELENDPTIFSTLLIEWGVRGIEVREIIPLDAIFDTPASSTYGFILLSRYVPTTPSAGSSAAESPPQDLWFANQTSSFSCATVALMNIINNRLDADLGARLFEFKDLTKAMSSKDRGHALDRFSYVKNVHNSFASEFDKMNVDMRLKEQATAAARQKAATSKKSRKRKKAIGEDDDDDSGFHFVAYVPACGQVWRMDGMEADPQSLGTVEDSDSWIAMIVADLQGLWESAELNQMEFSLLSLVSGSDDASFQADEARMKQAREDWGPFIAHMLRLHAEKGDIRETLV